jgi:hypothetical protein
MILTVIKEILNKKPDLLKHVEENTLPENVKGVLYKF